MVQECIESETNIINFFKFVVVVNRESSSSTTSPGPAQPLD